jgi:hypothetical protein
MHLAAELAAKVAGFENGAVAYPFAGHSPRPFRVRHNFCSATHFIFLRENYAHDAAGFHVTFQNLTRRAVGTRSVGHLSVVTRHPSRTFCGQYPRLVSVR